MAEEKREKGRAGAAGEKGKEGRRALLEARDLEKEFPLVNGRRFRRLREACFLKARSLLP